MENWSSIEIKAKKKGRYMEWEYMQPVVIHFGNGKIKELGDEILNFGGKNGILITSPSFEKRGIVEKIKSDSKGLIKVVYSNISPNPDVAECEECISLIKKNDCDFVVAVGGGSVLDCSKAAAVMCMSDRPVKEYLDDAGLLPDKSIPLIAVPTTAGTGSEITCVSVLSDHERGLKKPLSCKAFYPELAIVDPELTYSVPKHITASTGMDVLCHAIEAYWSKYHQPICDSLAFHAASLVFEYLRTAVNEPDNKEAREKMAEASVIAGLAFTIPKTTSAHACSYPLTNYLGIAHGEACALTIDYFLEINAKGDNTRLDKFSKMLGFSDAFEMAEAIRCLKKDIGIMKDLKEFNIDNDMLEKLIQASKHPNMLNNPVEITEDMLRKLYTDLI